MEDSLCLVPKCRNLKQAITDIANTVRLRYRYCPQDVTNFPDGIAQGEPGWPILCRCIVRAVIVAAAIVDS